MLLAALSLMGVGASPCALGAVAGLAPSAQVQMKAPRIYEGIWLHSFEGHQFFEGLVEPPTAISRDGAIWLQIDRASALKKAGLHTRISNVTAFQFYRVRFRGSEAVDMKCSKKAMLLPACYGHEGAFEGLVVVQQLLAITAVERAKPQLR